MVGDAEVGNRAAAITCAGCHFSSVGTTIGKLNDVTFVWPPSTEELHVAADGTLSWALTKTFLPFRKEKLFEFICAPSAAFPATNVDRTNSPEELEFQSLIETLMKTEGESNKELTARYLELLQNLQAREIEKDGYFVTNRRPD